MKGNPLGNIFPSLAANVIQFEMVKNLDKMKKRVMPFQASYTKIQNGVRSNDTLAPAPHNADRTTNEKVGESSSRKIDLSNMHQFCQRHPFEYHWTKDHLLEQVHGNPSKPIQTRIQLFTDLEILEETVIDEDEVIMEDETPELITKFQDVDKRVLTIYDYKRIKATLNDALSNQFKNAEEFIEVVRITTDQPHGLDFMEQIIVIREKDKPNSFYEADFKYLNKNDIEDLYYLCQNKKVNYPETKLMNSLITLIRSRVIWERVHDIQLNMTVHDTVVQVFADVVRAESAYEAKKAKELAYMECKELEFLMIDTDGLPERKAAIIRKKE
ncbi:hypothetical protein Tco_0193708 [Tanacetum coccineum]